MKKKKFLNNIQISFLCKIFYIYFYMELMKNLCLYIDKLFIETLNNLMFDSKKFNI